jgi:hypothetical protein
MGRFPGLNGLRLRSSGGGNESSGYIKQEELLLELGRYGILKKNSALWNTEKEALHKYWIF